MEQDFVPDDAALRDLLASTRTIAVVGLSADPMRPSHSVARYLHEAGYAIIPVNPSVADIWGLKGYPDLASAAADGHVIDLVDVFRRPEHVGPVVEEAIRIGAKALWLQEGVVNPEAAMAAQDAGLTVVMDRCARTEHRRLGV